MGHHDFQQRPKQEPQVFIIKVSQPSINSHAYVVWTSSYYVVTANTARNAVRQVTSYLPKKIQWWLRK